MALKLGGKKNNTDSNYQMNGGANQGMPNGAPTINGVPMGGGMPMGGGAGLPGQGLGELSPDMNATSEIGGEVPPEGMAPEGGIPPEGEAAGGQETPLVPPENLETQEVSYLNVAGQKFLIENKDDFFALMKYIKSQNKNTNSKDSEFMEEINSYGKKKHTVKGSNPYYFLNENNEFGGIIEKNRTAKLYEGSSVKTLPVLLG